MSKIAESSNQDIKILVEELNNINGSTEELRKQLDDAYKLAKKAAEEVAINKRIVKRVRITSSITGGAGIILGTTGYVVKGVSNDLGNILLFSGIGLAGSGIIGFTVSLPW